MPEPEYEELDDHRGYRIRSEEIETSTDQEGDVVTGWFIAVEPVHGIEAARAADYLTLLFNIEGLPKAYFELCGYLVEAFYEFGDPREIKLNFWQDGEATHFSTVKWAPSVVDLREAIPEGCNPSGPELAAAVSLLRSPPRR